MNGGPQARLHPGTVHPKHLLQHETNVVTTKSSRVSTPGNIPSLIEEAAAAATVLCAATGNRALSGLTAVDGVTIGAGDPVALPFQTNPIENGRYLASAGTWTRAGGPPIVPGATWEILQGTIYGNRQLVCTNDTVPVVGTDAITFEVRPGGTGTANYAARWTSTATLGIGIIKDDNTRVQINSSATTGILNVERNSTSAAVLYLQNTATTGTGTAIYAETDSTNVASHVAELHATGGGAGLYVVTASGGNGVEVNASGIGVQSNPTADSWAFSSTRAVSSATAALVNLSEDSTTATGTTVNVDNDGLGRTAHLKRNNASATEPVVEIHQDAGSGSQTALEINNDSTGAGHGVVAWVVGGFGVFGSSQTAECLYAYRPSTATGAAPTMTVWNDSATDAQDCVFIRSDGTGNAFVVNDGGAGNVFEIKDGGRANIMKALSLSKSAHSASFTLSVDTCVYLIDTAAAAGNVTGTLPDDASMPAGWTFELKDIGNNAATRNIILARGAGDTYTINNVAGSFTIATNKRGAKFYWDGTNMHVLHISTS